MKKMFIPVLALLGMIACTNENEPEIQFSNSDPVEIKMIASVVDVNAKTRAVVNSGTSLTDVALLRTDAKSAPDWTTAEIKSITANIAEDGTMAFNAKQYYPTDNTINAYFTGYYPAGTLKNGIVTFTGMDGSQDIMYASQVNGNKDTQDALAITLNHQLSQLQFKFNKDASFEDPNVTVASIIINGTKTPETLNIANGTIGYAANATSITAFESKTYKMDATVVIPEKGIIQAGASAITLNITLSNGVTFSNVPITLTTKASTAHVITLTFKQKEVNGSATIGTWTEEESGAEVA